MKYLRKLNALHIFGAILALPVHEKLVYINKINLERATCTIELSAKSIFPKFKDSISI